MFLEESGGVENGKFKTDSLCNSSNKIKNIEKLTLTSGHMTTGGGGHVLVPLSMATIPSNLVTHHASQWMGWGREFEYLCDIVLNVLFHKSSGLF